MKTQLSNKKPEKQLLKPLKVRQEETTPELLRCVIGVPE